MSSTFDELEGAICILAYATGKALGLAGDPAVHIASAGAILEIIRMMATADHHHMARLARET